MKHIRFSNKFKLMAIGIAAVLMVYFVIKYFVLHEINLAVTKTIEGIEKEDISLAFAFISDNYQDNYGYTREDLISIAKEAFSEFEDIRIHLDRYKLEKKDYLASVFMEIKVVATYGPQRGYLLGSPQDAVKITVSMQKENLGWRIRAVTGDIYRRRMQSTPPM